MDNEAADLAKIALALSDPMRLKILDILTRGRDETCLSPLDEEWPLAMCPMDLLRKVEDVGPSRLSYHLRELQEAGLVCERRRGKRIYYTPDHTVLSYYLSTLAQRYRQ